jgi:acyl carrier protein
MNATTPVRAFILAQMEEIAGQQKKKLRPLSDELPLLESGLDSLCIAILVAALDDELGLDPFAATNVDMPVTIGDFVRLYENAAG